MQGQPRAAAEVLKKSERAWIASRDANAALVQGLNPTDSGAVLSQQAADAERRRQFLEWGFIRRQFRVDDPSDAPMTTADQQLTIVYQDLRRGLNPAASAALLLSERAWIVSRDADLAALKAAGSVQSDNAARAFARVEIEARTLLLQSIRSPSADVRRRAEITAPSPGTAAPTGEGWAYEFIDDRRSSPKVAKLWRLNNERLLFTNDEWIVTGSFIALGLGRGKCEPSFCDARSLALAYSLSFPNHVLHLDWSPAR